MHLYWRIKEELLYLGEILVFHDPRFTREYNRWFQRRGRSLHSREPELAPTQPVLCGSGTMRES